MNDEVRNPFPGLRPFEFTDNHLFFGRDEQTTELTTRLRKNRFVAVVGTSGSGKSSLVRSGLLPELLSGTMAGAGSSWETAIMRPGGDPLSNLANAIVEEDLYDPEEEDITSQVRATLTRSGLGLVETMRQSDLPEGTNFLLVVDQFEEIFRFRRSDDATDEQAAFFVNLLLEASAQSDLPLYIIITMRSDFLGECSQFPRLADTVNEGEFLIPRLNRDQRKEAIIGPVKVAGGGITDRLLLRLLNDIGDDPDQLPILQHALMRTWDLFEEQGAQGDLDLEHYHATGGMAEALSRHADEVFGEQPDDEHRRIAQKLFKSLTEKVDANRGIRRPMPLSELHEICGGEEAHLREVVDDFRRTGCTFLMPAGEREITLKSVIDISHESLMRVWRSLRNWVDEEAQSAKIYRRLADTATLFKEGKAGLYRDPDLQIALSWRKENQPNKTWADRYYPGFDVAMTFLDNSHEEAIKEERAQEEARQRELDQANALAEAQEKRASAQAKTAKIFKFAGACLFILLCASIYLTVLAINSKKEVSDKIFQLASRSTATASRAIDRDDYYKGMAWYSDAIELSKGDTDSQNLVAKKIKSFLSRVPILYQSDLSTSRFVDYRFNNEDIYLYNEGWGYISIKKFDIRTHKIGDVIHSFPAKFYKISEDGSYIFHIDNNNKPNLLNAINGKKQEIKIQSDIIECDINQKNRTIFLLSQTDKTTLSIYAFDKGLSSKIKLNYLLKDSFVYSHNAEIILGGNINIEGENFNVVKSYNYNGQSLTEESTVTNEGNITNHSFNSYSGTFAYAINNKNKNYILSEEFGRLNNNIKKIELLDSVSLLKMNSIGTRAVISDITGAIFHINLRNGNLNKIATYDSINDISFSKSNSHIIINSENKGVEFYNPITFKKSLPTINLGFNVSRVFFDKAEQTIFLFTRSAPDNGLFSFKLPKSGLKFINAELSSVWSEPWPYKKGDQWFFRKPAGPHLTSAEWHGPANLAIDGNLQTMVHSNSRDREKDPSPYWKGELAKSEIIKQIEIVNRHIGPKQQMGNYEISILDEDEKVVWKEKFLDKSNPSYAPPENLICTISGNIKGKYIKIQGFDGMHLTLSFAEVFAYGNEGINSLTNEEVFNLSSAINLYKLSKEGELEQRNMADLNNSLFEIKGSNYFNKIFNNRFDDFEEVTKSKINKSNDNDPNIIFNHDYLISKQGETNHNLDYLYANSLLNEGFLDKAHKVFSKIKNKIDNKTKANLVLLSNYLDKDFTDIELNTDENIISEIPELLLLTKNINSNIVDEVSKRLPGSYKPNIVFSDSFYQNFIIDVKISNDSEGDIFYMGGKEFINGISMTKNGNQIEINLCNSENSEKVTETFFIGNVPSNGENWGRHVISFSHETKKANYFLNGLMIGSINFNSRLSKDHPNIILGADSDSQTFGNIKISEFKIWDNHLSDNEILKSFDKELQSADETNLFNHPPLFELNFNIEIGLKGEAYIVQELTNNMIDEYGNQTSEKEPTHLSISNKLSYNNLYNQYLILALLNYYSGDTGSAKEYLILSSKVESGKYNDEMQYYIAQDLLGFTEDEMSSKFKIYKNFKDSTWRIKSLLKLVKNRK